MKIAEENLKYIIKRFSYKELSKMLGLSIYILQNMKLGRKKIDLQQIIKICEIFNLDLKDFCTKKIKIKFEFE